MVLRCPEYEGSLQFIFGLTRFRFEIYARVEPLHISNQVILSILLVVLRVEQHVFPIKAK